MSVARQEGMIEAPEGAGFSQSPTNSGGPEPTAARGTRRRRRLLGLVLSAVAATILLGGVYRLAVRTVSQLPTASARQGEFLVIVRCRGELRARRSVQVSAPVNVPELRIVWLAPSGEPIEAGQPVIRFDPSSARRQLNEKKAELERSQASLEHAVAQARIVAEQDRLDLARAQYEVEKARLEVSKSEIISAMEAEEKRIEMRLAQRKLRVQEAAVELHEASEGAKIASQTRVRDQAQADVELTETRLEQMEIGAPINGIVTYLQNFSQGWRNAKPFKVGDQVWPGAAIAEVPDVNTLEMEGKLEEIDRGRVQLDDEVRVKIDSLPELSLSAKLAGVSPLTQQGFEWPPTRTFRGYARIEDPDPRLRPGMNGSIDIVVDRLADVIIIPAKALFARRGQPTVYLAEDNSYRSVAVEILARNPDEVAIAGIPSDSRVALAEPKMSGPVR